MESQIKESSIGEPVWAAVTLNRDLPSNYSVSFRTRIVDGDLSELIASFINRPVRESIFVRYRSGCGAGRR